MQASTPRPRPAADRPVVRLETPKVGALRAALETFKDLSREVKLTFGPDGVVMENLDTSQVAVIKMQLAASAITSVPGGAYEFGLREPLETGFDTNILFRIVKFLQECTTLTVAIESAASVEVHLIGRPSKGAVRRFVVPMINIEYAPLNFRDFAWDVILDVGADVFYAGLQTMNVTEAKVVNLDLPGGTDLVMYGRGTLGASEYQVPCRPAFWSGRPVLNCCCAVSYLVSFTKYARSECRMWIGTGLPVMMAYDMPALGSMQFVLSQINHDPAAVRPKRSAEVAFGLDPAAEVPEDSDADEQADEGYDSDR